MTSQSNKSLIKLIKTLHQSNLEFHKEYTNSLQKIVETINENKNNNKWPIFHKPYDGNSNSTIINNFINELKLISSKFEWNDKKLIEYAALNLVGDAHNWYYKIFSPTVIDTEDITFDHFVTAITEKFEKRFTSFELCEKLIKMKFYYNNPMNFLDQFQELCISIPEVKISEEVKVILFKEKLKGIYKKELQYRNPQTLKEAYLMFEVVVNKKKFASRLNSQYL